MPGQTNEVAIRPVKETDAAFVTRVARRLHPGPTASPRDPLLFQAYFEQLSPESLLTGAGSMAFIAEVNGMATGIISAHLDVDYFTNHARLYVDTLAVAEESEGHCIGKALMHFIEDRGRELGCHEIVLDVFVTNDRALDFYERCGYSADHIRMSKPL